MVNDVLCTETRVFVNSTRSFVQHRHGEALANMFNSVYLKSTGEPLVDAQVSTITRLKVSKESFDAKFHETRSFLTKDE